MIIFEKCFLKADNIRAEFIYQNLELFVMGIVTVYVPLYYCFHTVFGGALDLDFTPIATHENSMSDSDE